MVMYLSNILYKQAKKKLEKKNFVKLPGIDTVNVDQKNGRPSIDVSTWNVAFDIKRVGFYFWDAYITHIKKQPNIVWHNSE